MFIVIKRVMMLLLLVSVYSNMYGQFMFRLDPKGRVIINKAAPYESSCDNNNNYTLDGGDSLTYFKGDLRKYFLTHINWRDVNPIAGVVFLQVVVDTSGLVCCKCISHMTINTNRDIMACAFNEIIDGMPPWQPAIKNNTHVSSTTIIALYFRVKDRGKEFDVDYFRLNNSRDVIKLHYK